MSDYEIRILSPTIHLLIVVLVLPALHGFQPVLVVQVPLDGLGDPGFEGVLGLPAQFFLYLRGVNGVPAVMALPVLYTGD